MKNKTKTARFITRCGAVGAIYVVLTLVSALLGLSSGPVQLRLSESLCLLPLIMPEAVLGLTVGCAISNLLTSAALWDIVFGSVATLIGAIITRALKNFFTRFPILAPLPTILANSIILPFILMLVYSAEGTYILFFASILIGEALSAGVLGLVFYKRLSSSSALRNLIS